MEENLLPCPFCGGEAKIIKIGNSHTKSRRAKTKCTKCHTEQVTGAIYHTLDWCCEKAIEKWNTRIK